MLRKFASSWTSAVSQLLSKFELFNFLIQSSQLVTILLSLLNVTVKKPVTVSLFILVHISFPTTTGYDDGILLVLDIILSEWDSIEYLIRESH